MDQETQDVPMESTSPVLAEAVQPTMANDRFDSIIQFAQKSEELGRAHDKIRKFVLSRALPGDWVRFGQKDKSAFLELSGAGAFRIASVIGVSWKNWKSWKESGTDKNGEWFTWWYQCAAHLQGRIIEGVQGRAGSRDKLFGYTAAGGWKELADVKETDIRVAARRNAMKEGVKLLLGLLHMPEEVAGSLGLPLNVVRGHTFGSGNEMSPDNQTETSGETSSVIVTVKDVLVKSGTTGKKTWSRYTVISDKDAKFTTFDTELAKIARDAKNQGSQIEIEYVTGKFGNEIKDLKSLANDGVES